MTNSASAFGQTFQYITAIKLHELEKQRETCMKYVDDTLADVKIAKNPVSQLDILLNRIHGWKGVDDNHPSFQRSILTSWSSDGFIWHETTLLYLLLKYRYGSRPWRNS
ncbi:MAG: hypothetical protein NXY57DRAFT_714525 [Lentinula lateritia]|nr:MAG: hypothetical protein NXY57DRAFT_714525 [Lentinula lateritia]